MKQTKIAIAGVSAAMLIGAGAGLALGLPNGAGAQGTDTTVTANTEATDDSGTDNTTDDSSTDDTTTDQGTDEAVPARGGMLKDLLAELVTAGTITQEQADAITAAIDANRPAAGERPAGPGHGGHGGGMGGPGFRDGRGATIEAAATALGITADELRTELQAGKSIADVAAEKGVDVQTVIDAIVAAETAELTERVTNMVNGVRPEKPVDQADEPADEEATTTTTG